jgi:malate synthase
VAHPALVPLAREIFDEQMKAANQISMKREDVVVTAQDLLTIPTGDITEEGARWNIDVGLQYLAAWLNGNGCVPIYNLMEDAATAEISRVQVWQWIRHGAKLEDGRTVSVQMLHITLADVMSKLAARLGEERFRSGKFTVAGKILERTITKSELPEFLTLVAYDYLK